MARITVGMPVYKGVDQVGDALRSLQQQTFRDFEVIISVDGNDQETAAACRPFLADKRFRMVVQPERLDWFGNFNWLLAQPIGEFFCYRQHDDTTAPEFFEALLATAEAGAAGVCRLLHGGRSDLETAPSIEGDVLDRMRQYIETEQLVVRISGAAIAQAGQIRADEFRGLSEVFVWLAKVLRWGSFIRVPEPLYNRLDHAENYHKHWFDWPDEKKRAAWTTLFTGWLEATMPVCRTAEERVFFQQFILDRIAVYRPGFSYHYAAASPHETGVVMLECIERLAKEGNLHLFDSLAPDARPLQAELARLTAANRELANELETLKRSRALALARRCFWGSAGCSLVKPATRWRSGTRGQAPPQPRSTRPSNRFHSRSACKAKPITSPPSTSRHCSTVVAARDEADGRSRRGVGHRLHDRARLSRCRTLDRRGACGTAEDLQPRRRGEGEDAALELRSVEAELLSRLVSAAAHRDLLQGGDRHGP